MGLFINQSICLFVFLFVCSYLKLIFNEMFVLMVAGEVEYYSQGGLDFYICWYINHFSFTDDTLSLCLLTVKVLLFNVVVKRVGPFYFI